MFDRRWLIVPLLVLLVLIQAAQPTARRRHRRRFGRFSSRAVGCEPVRLNMCRTVMPYSKTRMPNLLHHTTQRNARLILDQYQSLVDTRCGAVDEQRQDFLVFYLCAVFAPICPAGFDLTGVRGAGTGATPPQRSRRWSQMMMMMASDDEGTIPPCRAVCETARYGCEPVMRQYNVSWPPDLECSQWPTQDRGICISPASISTIANRASNNSCGTDSQTDCGNCRCKNEFTRLSPRNAFLRSQFDFVIRATYKKTKRAAVRGSGSGETRTIVRVVVRQVLVGGPQEIAQRAPVDVQVGQRITLWPSDCSAPFCARQPRLTRGHDYLVMGHWDHSSERLVLDQRSVVEKWKSRWPAQIQAVKTTAAAAKHSNLISLEVSGWSNLKPNVNHGHNFTEPPGSFYKVVGSATKAAVKAREPAVASKRRPKTYDVGNTLMKRGSYCRRDTSNWYQHSVSMAQRC